jgi:hypothetical protein
MSNNISGKQTVTIKNSEGNTNAFELVLIPETGKRPTVAVHGVETASDVFINAADQVKKAQAEQGGKKEVLIKVAGEIRKHAESGGFDIPDTVRYNTNNGRSVVTTAKYNGVVIDDKLYAALRTSVGKDDLEELITEKVDISIDLSKAKSTKRLVRRCIKALEGIVNCEEKITYKTNSGVEMYRKVEELLNAAGEDLDLIESLTALRTAMAPGFGVTVSTKIATSKH